MDRRAGVKNPFSAVRGLDGDHMAFLGSNEQVEIKYGPSQRHFGDSFNHEHLLRRVSLRLIGARHGDVPATALAVLYLESENQCRSARTRWCRESLLSELAVEKRGGGDYVCPD